MNSRFRRWTQVTVVEMNKYFAILLNMGLTVRKAIPSYWDTRHSQDIPFYSQSMSYNRFRLITSFLHLTSVVTVPKDNQVMIHG